MCPGQGIERRQVLNLLSSLVNKSLVVAHTLQRDEARYQLLESVRQYTHEKLRDAGEENALRDRHLSCFLQLVEEAAAHQKEAGQTHWLERLQVEYSSIRSAMAWALESGKIEAGLRMTAVLRDYWSIHGLMDEGLSWTDRLLGRAGEAVPALLRARVCYQRGRHVSLRRQRLPTGPLCAGSPDPGRRARRGRPARAARSHCASGIRGPRRRRPGSYADLWCAVDAHVPRLTEEDFRQRITIPFALTAMTIEDYQNAHLILENGIAALREAGEMTELADTMNILGDLYRCEQDYSQVQSTYEESVAILRELGAERHLASALRNLGYTCFHQGQVERANELFDEALRIQQTHQNPHGIGECLLSYAALALADGLPGSAARLLAAAIQIGGRRIALIWPATQKEYNRMLSAVEARLDERELRVEQAAGRA